MAHVSIIYPRTHKWKNANKEDKEKAKNLVSNYLSVFETVNKLQKQYVYGLKERPEKY